MERPRRAQRAAGERSRIEARECGRPLGAVKAKTPTGSLAAEGRFPSFPESMLDTIHSVETPEGVELNLEVAGPVARALSWAIDISIQFGIYVTLWTVLYATLGSFGTGLFTIGAFVMLWFYPVLFECLWAGQTPGKRAMGLCVVHGDGTPVGWNASILRNLLWCIDILPFLYTFGFASMLIDRSFRRLGDLAAGTLVVYARESLTRRGALPDAAPLPPPVPLELDEQRAVIAFAERAPLLSRARAVELAAIPTPLLGDEEPRLRLFRIAAWLVGRPGGSGS